MGNLAAKAIFKKKKEVLNEIPQSFFSVGAVDIDGKHVKFEDFKGKHKAFLVTNVASQ